MGRRTGTTSVKIIENKKDYKRKVVLLKLDLDSIIKMAADRAIHELADQVLASNF